MEFRYGPEKKHCLLLQKLPFPLLFIYNFNVITIIKMKLELDKPSYSISCICKPETISAFLSAC